MERFDLFKEQEFEASEWNVYNDKYMSDMLEDDMLEPEEEAFMRGYNECC